MSNSRGFTIIELLVVISIIAILASVTMASLISARVKARDTRRGEDVHQIQTALALYYTDCHRFPTTLTASANTGCPSGITLGNFLNPVPLDPTTNAPYAYAGLGSGVNCTSYHIGVVMELAGTAVLASDRDHTATVACTGSNPDFSGLSAVCDATAGTAAPGGTERCYDVKP